MSETSHIRCSVVIPAHNEERVIRRCLDALTAAAEVPDDIEVVVVTNACTDDTSRIVDEYPAVIRVDTATPGKANALNLGDDHASGFPRLYLDADVVLTCTALDSLLAHMHENNLLAVSPTLTWDDSGLGRLNRRYYRYWRSRRLQSDIPLGSGAYLISRAGRTRFQRFPTIISDDGFVSSQFTSSEKALVPDAEMRIFPPVSLRSLITIKTRAKLGDLQLQDHLRTAGVGNDRRFGDTDPVRPQRSGSAIDMIVYFVLRQLITILARRRGKSQNLSWSRDDSSR